MAFFRERRNAFRKNRDNFTYRSGSDRRCEHHTSPRLRQSYQGPCRVDNKSFHSCCLSVWYPRNQFRPPKILCYCHCCHCSGSSAIYFSLQLAHYGIWWYVTVNRTNYKIGLLERVKNAFRKNRDNVTCHSSSGCRGDDNTSARLRQSSRGPWRVACYLLIPFSLDSRHRGNHLRQP